MTTTRARRIITTALATVALAACGITSASAHTTSVPSRDTLMYKASNAGCHTISDDVQWQDCVTGSVINALHRGITSDDYEVNASGTALIPTHATRHIGNRRYSPTPSDVRHMASANRECQAVSWRTTNWESCIIGEFAAETGTFITDRDTVVRKGGPVTYILALRNGHHNAA